MDIIHLPCCSWWGFLLENKCRKHVECGFLYRFTRLSYQKGFFKLSNMLCFVLEILQLLLDSDIICKGDENFENRNL